jgi:hypothetical protein
VLEATETRCLTYPPDPETKWQIIIDADAPEEVQRNPERFIRFVGPDPKTAIGATAVVSLSPLPSGRGFKANVLSKNSKGQQSIRRFAVGGM